MYILIKGRYECYVRKSSDYNPYTRSDLYDWQFRIELDDFIFTDSYRGFNPYSGVEYVYMAGYEMPVWSCDYIGYVEPDNEIAAGVVYEFLKEARGAHLKNCNGDLFSDYQYKNSNLQYKTSFQVNTSALLQMENFFYKDKLIARQMSAGKLK
jgi:hypothetical protein